MSYATYHYRNDPIFHELVNKILSVFKASVIEKDVLLETMREVVDFAYSLFIYGDLDECSYIRPYDIDRYQNDPVFYGLVNSFLQLLKDGGTSPDTVREAIDFAYYLYVMDGLGRYLYKVEEK